MNHTLRSWSRSFRASILSGAATILLSMMLHPAGTVWAQSGSKILRASQKTAIADVVQRSNELKSVNHAIWEYAEVGLKEYKSSALLIRKLEAGGFKVKKGVANMPTAFVASFGSGRPIIGVLAEYDALPDMSQKTIPQREPLKKGAAGHACGHSGLGTGALGAALAIKTAMQKHGLKGTIRLYGTPAEETVIGKIYMLLDKQFDDLDFCLHWHPSTVNGAANGSSKALVSAKFTFRGIPAHGAVSPHAGRSALDAVELMNVGVNFMREHVKEDARMHYVITNGGGQPNVVPPEATVWYFVRADKHEDVEYNYKWVTEIAQGAAKMTRTKLSIRVDTDCHELIPNTAISQAIYDNMVAIGAPKFSDQEKLFARRMQQPLVAEFGTKFPFAIEEDVKPLSATSKTGKGSTDVGDISWYIPTGGFRTTCMAAGSPGHSWQNVACIGSPIGDKGTLFAAKVMAVTALDLFENPKLASAARAEFKDRMKKHKYTTLIPKGQKAPAAIR